ncbi:hypothetical protein DPMN_046617 [Dreissena polymorpha]|uniref:Uncharacterized protein n=1 Tax=Dreissena polymorpha TaxID=45954 RepID=A0A9D4I118_DREPO|nr:hypothetical protein DPMN_046617 [Dreissena polymorpha]
MMRKITFTAAKISETPKSKSAQKAKSSKKTRVEDVSIDSPEANKSCNRELLSPLSSPIPSSHEKPNSERRNHSSPFKSGPAQALWITVTLTTVGIIFPRDKAKAIGEAFLQYMGGEVARPLHQINKGLIFKIRKDCLNKAEKFSYNKNKYDFTLTVKSPQAKGIIHVSKSANITKIKQELQAKKKR